LGPLFYTPVPSNFGTLSLVWQETGQGLKVIRLFLPDGPKNTREITRQAFMKATPSSSPVITELSEQIQRFLQGEAIDFEPDIIALGGCSEFQRRVLLAEHNIPRGWVSTYQRIAASLGMPDSARAVGRALADNPFPILIPCHRAIRSNGELGGFQGGLGMKRALLELEGAQFSPDGRIVNPRIYY